MKINFGAGGDIRDGYLNHDIVNLEGIDMVFDLNEYPWPIESCSVDEILMNDVIEHLNDFMRSMEEIYRILKPQGFINLSVPYWNSAHRYMDPTHKYGFHENTFRFFDPSSEFCQQRHYYSHARFQIIEEKFLLIPFDPYFSIPKFSEFRVKSKFLKKVIGFLGNVVLSNLILALELKLKKI